MKTTLEVIFKPAKGFKENFEFSVGRLAETIISQAEVLGLECRIIEGKFIKETENFEKGGE